MEMGAPKTIKATVGRAESRTVTVYWRGPQIHGCMIQTRASNEDFTITGKAPTGAFVELESAYYCFQITIKTLC